MNTLKDYLTEQLKDPSFKRKWEKGEATYQVTRELIGLLSRLADSMGKNWK